VWQIDTQLEKSGCPVGGAENKVSSLLHRKDNAMTGLTSLKLTAAQKPTQMSPIQQRRNKMAKRLWEQAELAKAQQAGTTFAPTRFRSVVQNDTGLRRQVEVSKRIKQWWFVADNGKLALSVRYGSKLLELAKGKWAVEVGSEKDLVPTLELLKGAVLAGELDTQIEAAANKLREGFSN
jgi:ABC-type phosphate/phosphonate transport system ATPase subunit